MTDELNDLLQVGQKIIFDYGPDNINTRTLEVRAIVDDVQIVTREWSQRKHFWMYRTEHLLNFEMALEKGVLKKA